MSDVVKYILTDKCGEKQLVYTVRITLGEDQGALCDISAETALLIATDAINTFPPALTNLPSGSKVSWEIKNMTNLLGGTAKPTKGRKRSKKKCKRTTKRSSST